MVSAWQLHGSAKCSWIPAVTALHFICMASYPAHLCSFKVTIIHFPLPYYGTTAVNRLRCWNRETYSEILVWKHFNNTNPLQKQWSKYILWIIHSNTILYSDNRSMIRFPIQKSLETWISKGHRDLLWWPERQVVFPISAMACDVTAGLFMSEGKSNYVIECCLEAAAAVM